MLEGSFLSGVQIKHVFLEMYVDCKYGLLIRTQLSCDNQTFS